MKPQQRILIVDDEEAVLFSYKGILSSPTVTVDVCGDLDAALAFTDSAFYNAILTDLRLSHSQSEEGLHLLSHVASHHPLVPVILMSAFGEEKMRRKALSLGAHAFLDKPIQLKVLLSLLDQLGISVDHPQ